ncbi:MAG: hypothetical protein M1541_11305 [Acidobacteria bacterium]|nr:hypothetical protein [Acidobacteriota bacterium]
MRKHLSLEEKLGRLGELDPASPETSKQLARHLGGKNHLLATRAAQLAARFRLPDLAPNLLDAFEFFTLHPEIDRGCSAKRAAVEALRVLEHRDPAVYLRAVRHVQLEAVWGGRQDTAGGLRA